jgi:hypothetical protein
MLFLDDVNLEPSISDEGARRANWQMEAENLSDEQT